MRDEMRIGDQVLFYHSSTKIPAVIGTATIVKEAYKTNRSIIEIALEKTNLSKSQLLKLLDPKKLI